MTKAPQEEISLDEIDLSKQDIPPKRKDDKDQKEKLDYEHQRALTEQVKEATRVSKANREMREANAKSVFRYLVWYSVFVGALLVLNGWGVKTGFVLPDVVLTALVGSTAASAIGLMAIVVNGLFRKDGKE